MNEKQIKHLKKLILAVQILAVIILLFLGYIIYDYLRNNEETADYYEIIEPYEQ